MRAGAKNLRLHPIQQDSCDPDTREAAVDIDQRLVTVPPRTASVFAEERQGSVPDPAAQSSYDIYEVDSYIRNVV